MKITLLEVWDNIAATMQITIQNGDQIGENKNIKFSPTLCDYTISEFDISNGVYEQLYFTQTLVGSLYV